MPQVHYSSINLNASTDDPAASILDVSIENQIPHTHECGGNGKCTTCRVRILDGMENVSKKSREEKSIAYLRRWDPSIRLACQCRIKGDVTIQRLVWSSAEVNKLQMETVPEGEAEERPIAILFCDLRNFTSISAKNLPFDMAHMLNRFYTLLGEPILMNNGIIYQYVGDEIIGVFGTAGGTKDKNCTDAVRAAMGMKYAVENMNKIELKHLDTEFNIGIGVHYGVAYIGHLGHPNHRQFSVVGDPVNVTSRIQGETKKTVSEILLSKNLIKNIDPGLLHLGRTFQPRLKGIEDRIEISELVGFNDLDVHLELQSSLSYILNNEEDFAERFYERVFSVAPFVRRLFTNDMIEQGRMLTHMLGGIVYSLARPEFLELGLKKLGKSHKSYGVKDEYYPVVKDAMIATIGESLPTESTKKTLEAWSLALDQVICIMKESMAEV